MGHGDLTLKLENEDDDKDDAKEDRLPPVLVLILLPVLDKSVRWVKCLGNKLNAGWA